MSVSISIKLDTSAFESYGQKLTQQLAKNLRSAVNGSARTARRAAIVAIAKDSGLPASAFRAEVPLVRGATAGGALRATWTISKPAKGQDHRIRGAGGKVIATSQRGSKVIASTFNVSGGGSDPLSLQRGFVARIGGTPVVMVRFGSGKTQYRPVYAERAVSGMAYEGDHPRKVWTKTATAQLAERAPAAVAKAFALADLPETTVGGDVIHDGDQT